MRGLPLGEWSEKEALACYMGISAHIGQAGPQWKCGK